MVTLTTLDNFTFHGAKINLHKSLFLSVKIRAEVMKWYDCWRLDTHSPQLFSVIHQPRANTACIF